MKNADNSRDNVLWHKNILKYAKPEFGKSLWQICNSLIPYILLWVAMARIIEYSYLLTLALSLLASGFLVRLFIIFHDCGHGSFFKSKMANNIVGRVMGIIAFTPYMKWHDLHHQHHTHTGNLDKRGAGDVWTMTVNEYLSSSPRKQRIYKAFRNPFFMFTVGPLVLIILNRLTSRRMSKKAKLDVYLTNFALLGIIALISYFIGFWTFLLIQVPLLLISHTAGLWLFYIQHQFEDVSWDRSDTWDYRKAAVEGSSFLKLPVVLQWFTGNIGFHHVHHLSSRIPNYNLAKCHYESGLFDDVKPVLLSDTYKALKLHLWDETSRRLISFRELVALRRKVVA